MNLTLKHPSKQWRVRYADVGFDANGRFLYIGTVMNNDVWMCFAPEIHLSNPGQFDEPESTPKPGDITSLTVPRFMAFAGFLANGLARVGCEDANIFAGNGTVQQGDFIYPNIESHKEFTRSSNVL